MKEIILKIKEFLYWLFKGKQVSKARVKVTYTDYNYIPYELETVELINAIRLDNSLKELTLIDTTSHLAEAHNKNMIKAISVSHNGVVERLANLIFQEGGVSAGENIAWNFKTPEGLVAAWMRSAGHKENILGDFTHFGISATRNSAGTYYVTNLFLKK
jgi:uncharacterized protein YkwD